MESNILPDWHGTLERLKNSQHALIVCHINPDLDALCAASAMAYFLHPLEVKCRLVFDGYPPAGIAPDKLQANLLQIKIERVEVGQFDMLILLDTASTDQLGTCEQIYRNFCHAAVPVTNIDHHQSNPGLGDFNLVDPRAAATCEILYELFSSENKIQSELADYLLKGIYSDTDLLRTANVTSRTIRIVADLVDLGADRMRIIEHASDLDVDTARMWARVIATVKTLEKNPNIAYAVADSSVVGSSGQGEPLLENLANYLRDLKGVDLAILFIQRENVVKLSFRSKSAINALEIAGRFGGGGHKTRAGCSFPGMKMADVIDLVVSDLQNKL
jgi:phosphoesterase RecJ-like protein